MPSLETIVAEIAAEMADASDRGTVADYIPALATIDPAKFGIAVVEADGTCHLAGDAEEPFSIQSISKVFSLTLALGAVGDKLWERVGREPSGSAFNSIVQLETEAGIPRNPFINAGAIVVADILLGNHEPKEAIGEILRFTRSLAGEDSIFIDGAVAAAEQATGFRNVALANYMRAFGNIRHPAERTLGVYFNQCAMAMSCRWEWNRNCVRGCAMKFPTMFLTGARRDSSDAENLFALFAARIGMTISAPNCWRRSFA